MRPHRALVLLAAAQLGGCFFSFKNPSEDLRAGQVSGTVLADVSGGGTPIPKAGVAISLKGGAFDQASRPNGRFTVLDLPAGQHTLLFRNGTTWALERGVTIGYGSDGQPEGIELGDVVLHYSAAVKGTVSLPPGNTIAGGVAVDESSGLTAALQLDPVVPPNPAPPARFSFPMLALGTHLIKLHVADTFAGIWVGGQVVVNVTAADQGTTITLADVAARAASSTGRLRFRVQPIGLALPATSLAVNLTPNPGLNPITPASDGTVDVTVPEGLYAIGVVAPPTAPPLALEAAAGGGGAPLPALASVTTVAPPPVYGVVLQGRVAEAGSAYVAADPTIAAALNFCRTDADCGAATCAGGACLGQTPSLPAVTARTTFCAACQYSPNAGPGGPCLAGPNVPGACACPDWRVKAGTCLVVAAVVPPEVSYCAPLACFKCTPDATTLVSYTPPTGVCP